MTKIAKSVSIAFSADHTAATTALRKIDRALKGLKDPTEEFQAGIAKLDEKLEKAEISSKQYAQASKKLEDSADRQRKKVKKLNAEIGRQGGFRQNSVKAARKALARKEQLLRDEVNAHRKAYKKILEAKQKALRKQKALEEKANSKRPEVRLMRNIRDSVGALIGPLVVLTAAFEGLKKSISLAAELEASEAKLRVFTGSATVAKGILTELRDLSTQSPVSFAAGQRGVTTMLQFGVAADEVVLRLKQIAEITGGDTQRMEMLALAFAQSQAAGRLMGQELLQMVNAGFNPLKVISEETGESLVELKKRMEDGGISSQAVADAFEKATSEGGKFNGLLAEMADTGFGKLVKIQSQLEKIGTSIGSVVLSALELVDVIEGLERMEASTSMYAEAVRTLADAFAYLKKQMPNPEATADSSMMKLVKEKFQGGGAEVTFKAIEKINDDLAGWPDYIAKAFGSNAVEDSLNKLKALRDIQVVLRKDAELRTEAEKEAVKIYEQQQRKIKNVSAEEADLLYQAMMSDLEQTKNLEDRIKLQQKFAEKVGQGYLSDAYLERLKEHEETMKIITAEKEKQKRIDEAFAGTDGLEDQILGLRYGEDAERVRALVAQSTDEERKKLENLVEQGMAYEDIYNAANAKAQVAADEMEMLEEYVAHLEKQKEDAEKLAEEKEEALEKEKEALKKLVEDRRKAHEEAVEAKRKEQQANADLVKSAREELRLLKIKVKYGDEIARRAELRAQNPGITKEQIDKIMKFENERDSLQAAADDRKALEDRAEELNNPNKDVVDKLGELQALLTANMINQDVFDRTRQKLISDSVPRQEQSAVSNTTKGSQGAYALLTQQTLDKQEAQLQVQRETKLLMQLSKDALVVSAEHLKNLADSKPGVL
jgi:tape measure domain-containing protein